MFWWIAGFIWKAWCLAAGGGQIAEELLMWLQLPLESRCTRCPARANARAMAVHPLRPGGTGTHWPRTPASAYSWAEVGGRDCWEEEVAPQVFELSRSKPASQGSTGIRISKLFCWWIFCPQPEQPTLLYRAGGRFELLGLGQQPSLFFPHDCCGCGLAELTFLQVPTAGALLDTMHRVALQSPGLARRWRWDHASTVPWDGETKVAMAYDSSQFPVMHCKVVDGSLLGYSEVPGPESSLPVPRVSLPSGQLLQSPMCPGWLWCSAFGGWQSRVWCSQPWQWYHAKPPREEASAECSNSQLKLGG